MPNRTVYIRSDNLDKWTAISNRSEWINTLLENDGDVFSYAEVDPIVTEPLPIITLRNKDMDFCKHNAVKGFCKKGCK